MGEEMELRNGSLPREEGETVVMIPTSTTGVDPPTKPPPLHLHGPRNLAITSIICGCSCIGVLALIYAIKASEKLKASSQVEADYWARRSRVMSYLSIVTWVLLLILLPLLVILLSYIFSKAE
ncbi:transmembrane protein 265 [Elgaria multicarinata webbii]|uniref:transmembrane protein 265 n=1 Tax=Elgaria multicarinata webbii TaxID=159646 RepID=UPI002FCD357F